MSYHRVRGSISYIIGFVSSLVIAFIKFDEPDPLVFGIMAFAGFIIFTSITWLLTGLLLNGIQEENAAEDVSIEAEQSNMVDVTIGDGSEAQPELEDTADKQEQINPLLETLGSDGKVDWNKLSPIGEDVFNDDFVPLDMFSKNS